MHTFGKILVVWGVLLPLIALPSMYEFYPELGLLGSLGQMYTYILGEKVWFSSVIVLSALMVGFGLTSWILPEPPVPPERDHTAPGQE